MRQRHRHGNSSRAVSSRSPLDLLIEKWGREGSLREGRSVTAAKFLPTMENQLTNELPRRLSAVLDRSFAIAVRWAESRDRPTRTREIKTLSRFYSELDRLVSPFHSGPRSETSTPWLSYPGILDLPSWWKLRGARPGDRILVEEFLSWVDSEVESISSGVWPLFKGLPEEVELQASHLPELWGLTRKKIRLPWTRDYSVSWVQSTGHFPNGVAVVGRKGPEFVMIGEPGTSGSGSWYEIDGFRAVKRVEKARTRWGSDSTPPTYGLRDLPTFERSLRIPAFLDSRRSPSLPDEIPVSEVESAMDEIEEFAGDRSGWNPDRDGRGRTVRWAVVYEGTRSPLSWEVSGRVIGLRVPSGKWLETFFIRDGSSFVHHGEEEQRYTDNPKDPTKRIAQRAFRRDLADLGLGEETLTERRRPVGQSFSVFKKEWPRAVRAVAATRNALGQFRRAGIPVDGDDNGRNLAEFLDTLSDKRMGIPAVVKVVDDMMGDLE